MNRIMLALKRRAVRRQRKRGWKPGTFGYSPSLHMLDAFNAAPNSALEETLARLRTIVDDERRARGVPRTSDTPCAVDGCPVTDHLVRVNPKGEPGIFMCVRHAREVG